MAILSTLLVLLFFFIPVLYVIAMVKPSLLNKYVKIDSRKKVTYYSVAALLIVFILIGITAPKSQNNDLARRENAVALNDNPEINKARIAGISTSQRSPDQPEYYRITSVTDGDTLKIDINGKTETLRLIGIDTPETVDPRKPVECFGKEAADYIKGITTGKKVRLEQDSTQSNKDKYNRLLRYVYLEDGTSVNRQMIEGGYAFEYTYDSNPYKYQAEYKASQIAAREGARGLWAKTTCNGEHRPAQKTAIQPHRSEQRVNIVPAPVPPAPVPSTQPTPAPIAQTPTNCDPNYTPCVPNVNYDLDCGDIRFRVRVIGADPHRFDREGDGLGCESY